MKWLLLLAFLCGCSFAQRTHVAYLDQSITPAKQGWLPHRTVAATNQVDIFHDGQKPTRQYRDLAVFTVDGNHFEEPDAIAGFTQRAREICADAIIITADTSRAGIQINATSAAPFSTVNNKDDRYLYRAVAVRYLP